MYIHVHRYATETARHCARRRWLGRCQVYERAAPRVAARTSLS